VATGVCAALAGRFAQARDYEPRVHCVGALRVASGAELRPSAEVLGVQTERAGGRVQTRTVQLLAEALVNCARLHDDRIA
jgi:hypothetical protein